MAPIARAALLAAVVTGWTERRRRATLATAAGATIIETAVTVRLLRDVNPRLVVAGRQAPETTRPALEEQWHRLNRTRMLAASIAWCALAPPSRNRRTDRIQEGS